MPGFVSDLGDDVPEKVYVRVPNDPPPFDGYERSEVCSEGVCFPSQFVPDIPDELGDMASEDIRTAYAKIDEMVKENYANSMVTRDLVNNIFCFYEDNIRKNYPDMPVWTKKSIYNYIFFNSDAANVEERQTNESIRAIYHQIDFLRSHTASRDASSGKTVPELRNIKLLADLVKLHSQLVSSKQQRRK